MPTGHEKTAIPSGTVSVTAMVPLNWIPAPSSGPYRDKLQTACRLPWFPPTPRFGRRSVYTLTQSIVTTDSQTIAAKLNGEYIRAKNNNPAALYPREPLSLPWYKTPLSYLKPEKYRDSVFFAAPVFVYALSSSHSSSPNRLGR